PSVGQTGAALRAAASQDLAAVGGTHTLTEPVLLGALALLGLIGTNHVGTPPVQKSSGLPRPPQQPFGCGRQTKTALHHSSLHDAHGIIAYFKIGCQPL